MNLCVIVVILLASSLVSAEENHNSNVEEEFVPAEQSIDNSEISGAVKKKVLTKPVAKNLKPFVFPNLSRNIGPNTAFPFGHGLIQAPLVGLPLDAQASSATNNVLLVLNNDKNKLADLTNPSEQSLKRLTRTPDVVDDMVAQARGLGEGVTQQVMGQLTEGGSGLSRQLGQGLNDLVRQTATLAQSSPGNIDISQLAQTIRQSTPVGNFDFGSFGEGLTRSFMQAATQNVFNPSVGQAAPDAAAAEEADNAESLPDVVGAAAETEAEAEPEPAAEPAASEAATSEGQKNPFDSMLGSVFQPPGLGLGQALPGLQAITSLQQALPLGLLGPLTALNPLMAMGSEISEVRVMPDQYSPYKLSPKKVDQQTMAEMKLKAVLKDALNKKTLPILWFHLPNNQNVQKTPEDLEMEAKLKNFEKRVVGELKHLQELAKLANIVKEAQLESGVQPTKSLTTKLNLHDIPIYDITLGDIESTLKDEHVIMLMHTIVQRQHKEHHRHHQATTKYLTDLTGTPIKRQTKTAEDVLKSMERDDILKMLTYAYRMAAVSGHEMPWLKNDKVKGLKEKDASKSTTTSQAKDERQWLEDKQRQMAIEAGKQRQMAEEKKNLDTNQNQFRQWADAQLTQQSTMQQQMPLQRHMVSTQNQMFDPNMQQQMFNMQPQFPEQRQWIQPTNMQQQQPIMTNPMMQRQWADPNIQQQALPETKSSIKTEQLPEQRQAADTKIPEQQIATKTNEASMMPHTTAERMDSMPMVGEAKPQMAENSGQARHKGMEDMFNELDVFDHGKHKEKDAARPTVINYYYNAGGGRYQPLYAAPQSLPSRPPAVAPPPNYGYARPAAHPPQPAPAVAHTPTYSAPYGGASYGSNAYGSYSGYRAAVGDEEIAIMLQQHQPMPKLMSRIPINDVPIPAITNPAITTPNNNNNNNQTTMENHINNAADDANNTSTKSNDTSLPSSPTTNSSSTSSSFSSSPSLSESLNDSDSDPEVGSYFSLQPHILQPFMGLHPVDHPDDPWHHKAYDLYKPIFTGGGTFEEYLKTGRYKRDTTPSASSPFAKFSPNPKVLTPDMLAHLLRLKSNFKRNYPGLYKTMMGAHLGNDKTTKISITPPEVPKHVSYKNVELAAAEINPLETLIPSYQQDLQNIMEKQKSQPDSLLNSYKTEFNFWDNSKEVITVKTQNEEHSTSLEQQNLDEETSFWENSQETLSTLREQQQQQHSILENPEKFSLQEPHNFWANSQETLTESQIFLENPEEDINTHSNVAQNSQETVKDSLSYWENSQETLKTLNEQKELLLNSQDGINKEKQFWESNAEIKVEDGNSLNEHKIWENHLEPSAVQKRSSFWTELEAAEELEHQQQLHDPLDDTEPIFDFDEDLD
ncbi:defective chorion [Cochliomyia hominivorax]